MFSGGTEWKKIRSAGSKQVLPQRVAKFVTPLSKVAEDLMEQLEKSRDKDGNINDIRDFTVKWSFQGVCSTDAMSHMHSHVYSECVCVCVCVCMLVVA